MIIVIYVILVFIRFFYYRNLTCEENTNSFAHRLLPDSLCKVERSI